MIKDLFDFFKAIPSLVSVIRDLGSEIKALAEARHHEKREEWIAEGIRLGQEVSKLQTDQERLDYLRRAHEHRSGMP